MDHHKPTSLTTIQGEPPTIQSTIPSSAYGTPSKYSQLQNHYNLLSPNYQESNIFGNSTIAKHIFNNEGRYNSQTKKVDDTSLISKTSTIKETPFNQPCYDKEEKEFNKVSSVIDNYFVHNPESKEIYSQQKISLCSSPQSDQQSNQTYHKSIQNITSASVYQPKSECMIQPIAFDSESTYKFIEQNYRIILNNINADLDNQIASLELRVKEVTHFRTKYFENIIIDIKKEKERALKEIETLISLNKWNPQVDIKGIESIKRKIRDIGLEINDLKDLANDKTANKASLYYDAHRDSKVFPNGLRRSNSASKMSAFLPTRPQTVYEIPKQEQDLDKNSIFKSSRPLSNTHYDNEKFLPAINSTNYLYPQVSRIPADNGVQINLKHKKNDINIDIPKNYSQVQSIAPSFKPSEYILYTPPTNNYQSRTPQAHTDEQRGLTSSGNSSQVKSIGSSTPYNKYAQTQVFLTNNNSRGYGLDQENIPQSGKSSEVNLEQYKITPPYPNSNHPQHMRAQSFGAPYKMPFQTFNETLTSNTASKQPLLDYNNYFERQTESSRMLSSREIADYKLKNDMLNNRQNQDTSQMNEPIRQSKRQNSTSNLDCLQYDKEDFSQQPEDSVKKATSRNLQNKEGSNEDCLEESHSSNKQLSGILSNKKRSSQESHQSSRYSACNEDFHEDPERQQLKLSSQVYTPSKNSSTVHQEISPSYGQQFFSGHKFQSQPNTNYRFYSNQKCDIGTQADLPPYCQSNITASFQSKISEPNCAQRNLQETYSNYTQTTPDYRKNGINESNSTQITLNGQLEDNQAYLISHHMPDQRLNTARFNSCNEIQPKSWQCSDTKLNHEDQQLELEDEQDNEKGESRKQSPSQKDEIEELSLYCHKNTPSVLKRDEDSFSNEYYPNMKEEKNLMSNQVGEFNQNFNRESQSTQKESQIMNQYNNNHYQPEPIKDLNSFVSSQHQNCSQSYSGIEQEPSHYFQNNNQSPFNYLTPEHVDQEPPQYLEKEKILGNLHQKSNYKNNQNNYGDHKPVNIENYPIIEGSTQKQSDNHNDSEVFAQQENQNYSNNLYGQQNTSNYLGMTNNNNNSESMINFGNINKSLRENNCTEDSCSYLNMNSPKNDLQQDENGGTILFQSPTNMHSHNTNSRFSFPLSQTPQPNPNKYQKNNMETIQEIFERQQSLQSSNSSEIKNSRNNESINNSKRNCSNSEISRNNNNSKGINQVYSVYAPQQNCQLAKPEEGNVLNQSIRSEQIKRRESSQQEENQKEPHSYLGSVKARVFLTDREFREFLVGKGNESHSSQQHQENGQKLKNSQREEESKFAKCDVVYLYNSQRIKLLFTTDLLFSTEDDQAVIDQFRVQQINVDQIDFVNSSQNQVFLKISYKNEPSFNNKVILFQHYSQRNDTNGYFLQKEHLDNLKQKILLIIQLRNNEEELVSQLSKYSQQQAQHSSSKHTSSIDEKQEDIEEEDQEEEESKREMTINKQNPNQNFMVQTYQPSNSRIINNLQQCQQEQENSSTFRSNNSPEQSRGEQNSNEEKTRNTTPQFYTQDNEIIFNNHQRVTQYKAEDDENEMDIEKLQMKMNIERLKTTGKQEMIPITEESDKKDKNETSPQKPKQSYEKEQKLQNEVQIFSGYSNPNSEEKEKNTQHLKEMFMQNNQNQFSTIKREKDDDEQEFSNNHSQINEFKGSQQDYDELQDGEDDQPEFTSQQYEEHKSKQKYMLQCKQMMTQYNVRTPEEEHLLSILKKFDEKQYIMKKFGQNATSGQLRRIFFSSDFRFFCWKGLKSPELKKIIPISKFQHFILPGRSSENFKRFKTKNQKELNCSFSLVLNDRTIDLEANSVEEKEEFVQALQIIFRALL